MVLEWGRLGRKITAAALVAIMAAGCADSTSATEEPLKDVKIMAPAAPNGGWDRTARALQSSLERTKLAPGAEVYNIEGGAGTNGLKKFVNEEKSATSLMVTGLVMVGGAVINDTEKQLKEVTPLARLLDDGNAVIVPADSSLRSIDQFILEWKTRPSATPVGGGGRGSDNHVLAGLLATQVGIDPRSVNYVANNGGGPLMQKVLSGEVRAAISGTAEVIEQVRAGKIRVLAVSSSRRAAQLPEVKTLQEHGLGIVLTNWRGLVGPRGMADEAKKKVVAKLQKLRETPEWKQALQDNDWADGFMGPDEFKQYIDTEFTRVRKVLNELGVVR